MSDPVNSAPGAGQSRALPTASPWWTWLVKPLLWLLGLMAAGAISALCLLGIALATAYPNLPELDALVDYHPKLPMRIYSDDGVLIEEYGEERRHFATIDQIPKVMQDAVLAIEDSRFYEHGGVDYVGVLRAGLRDLGAARSQGASTITMQVARNFYLPTEKTLTRKIYEILLALKIESLLSKKKILEVYMNQIYLGQRAYGFSTACEIYFGHPLKDITIAEAAMLAGLPKAPSAYNPITNPKRALLRQQYILDRMEENNFITPEQRDAAKKEVLQYRVKAPPAVHAEYVSEVVRSMMFDQYGEAAYTQGLNVYTSIRAKDQEAAYHALRKGILDYDRRHGYRGPEGFVDLNADPANQDTTVAEALEDHPDNDELKAAVVLDASPTLVTAELQSGEVVQITGEGLRFAASALNRRSVANAQIRRGAVVRVLQSADQQSWSLTQLPEVQGAFVSITPQTGALRALVGGFDYAQNKFNHVTQAWRQPGSSFKPFIYSAALEKGFTPTTVINDAPLFFDAGTTGSQPWEPKNYDGTYDGPITMRRALAKSKNMVSIRILQSIGVHYAQDWITRFGFDRERHDPYLTMALGAGSVTPLQMADAYSVFANGGYRINPLLVLKVTDHLGKVLLTSKPRPLDESMRAIEARNAFEMDSLLQEVTRTGTAARAQATLKRPDLYGKTGTTNESMDAWFAGFQPSVAAIVWIGYDQPRKLGDKETGGGVALPVWIDYMRSTLQGVPVEEPQPPEGVVNIGGEWYYEEYTPATGISSLGGGSGTSTEDAPPAPSDESEKRSILDLFKN